jgi:type II secretory pathway pseudopilin PulG
MRSVGQRAFSLVEVTLALGIAGFALVAIFGLLPIGITSSQNTIEQTAAAGMARAIMADLRATPPSRTSSAAYKINIPNAGSGTTASQQILLREDASVDVTTPRGAYTRYLAYVTFNSSLPHSAVNVRVLITWPAGGDLNNNPPQNFIGSYEALSAVDRN